MKRVIGIDPGSRVTGYGVLEGGDGETRYVASGVIRLNTKKPMHQRLQVLHDELHRILQESGADEAAVERVFVARNAESALKLGHARGVILLGITQSDLSLSEYTPAQVKKTVTGRGRADKHQIQSLVRLILGIERDLVEDEADALAIAMTHLMLSGERAMLAEYLE